MSGVPLPWGADAVKAPTSQPFADPLEHYRYFGLGGTKQPPHSPDGYAHGFSSPYLPPKGDFQV